jgi:hypothetical protein
MAVGRTIPTHGLPPEVRATAAALAHPQPMRRGSLGERFMKCGKSTCACHTDTDARHGPYFVLTRGVAQATRSRYMTPAQAAVVRTQVEAGQQFRKQVDAYWEACEHWADAQLDATEAASNTEAAKKGASATPLRRKLTAKSRRS